MNRLPRVAAVRHISDYVLWLRFTDGVEGTVDLGNELRGKLLEPLRDVAVFSEARIEHGTVTWPNGADWAPETLHDRLTEISRFYGLVIRMFANDHAPPHFHAYYGDYEVTASIHEGIVTGQFPARALRLLLEWRDLHEEELIANWDRLRRGELPIPIAPLS